MATNESFGWDLLFKTIEPQVNKNADILIALTHFVLIKSKFRCLGVGDDKTLSEDEESSELLPQGWNDSEDKYSLRYVLDKKLFILLATKSENIFIINFLDVESKDVSNLALDSNELVKALKGSLQTIMPTASAVMDRIRKELIDPVFAGSTKAVTTQTAPEPRRDRRDDDYDPLRITGPHYAPGFRGPMGSDPFGFPRGGIGSGDLDPLGRGGGGSLGVLPRLGPHRGGARFDPFGPGPGVRPNPNHDEFPPPGFGDFMYQ
ncbi:proteasome inhibitor PI31 subunit [Episyrphus balteatus]|uniref:proteasome inhibitor PI31 subunit n=1 Tax=Episyrphus balteatus TaxID=286459 RepID=UPI002485A363|nr:proteasome inhibitor PI31 subunit [Episyrphus balteatus]XP_055839490.1 proteasome inhibitor PI31 subunit [Episyrphus balteatus]